MTRRAIPRGSLSSRLCRWLGMITRRPGCLQRGRVRPLVSGQELRVRVGAQPLLCSYPYPFPASATMSHIDLTRDDDDGQHAAKKCRIAPEGHFAYPSLPSLASTTSALYTGRSLGPPALHLQQAAFDQQQRQQQMQQMMRMQAQMHHQQPQQYSMQQPVASSSKQVIDLTTRTPSPPPRLSFAETPPNTPVCIGQLTVTALVLCPVDYIKLNETYAPPNPLADEWASVRLRCEEPDKRKKPGEETIHIHVPPLRLPDGRMCGGESFGVVEQKVANTLGPMLAKALIKVDARIRRVVNVRALLPRFQRRSREHHRLQLPLIIPLEMLVFTPKGNIHIVSGFLQQAGLLLDHPAADNSARLGSILYSNPHNPPPGGFRNALSRQTSAASRWTQAAPAGKSVEVQRSQVDDLFKNIQGGDDLPETEPGA